MSAGSLAERYARLEGRSAEKIAHLPRSPVIEPSEIHVKLMAVLSDLLDLMAATRSNDIPVPLLVAARTLKHMQREILEGLAQVPESEVRKVLLGVRERLDDVLST